MDYILLQILQNYIYITRCIVYFRLKIAEKSFSCWHASSAGFPCLPDACIKKCIFYALLCCKILLERQYDV